MTRPLALLAACLLSSAVCQPPQPLQPTVPDGGYVDVATVQQSCTRACARLITLGCPEMGDACIPTCEHVVTERISTFDPECVANASTVKEVTKCPAIQCRK